MSDQAGSWIAIAGRVMLRSGEEHSQTDRIIMNQETDRPVHSHSVSTGAAAARLILPTTAPSQSSSQ
jgi:hypothetical protein